MSETGALLGSLAQKRGVALEIEVPGAPAWARVDPAQMKQALANLVVNGIQAMLHGGRLTLRVERRRAEPPPGHEGAAGEFHRLDVCDQGIGIAAEDLSRVFEPFFTTKDVGEGTGLGLSVSYGIVREHGGWIAVDSAPGRGSRFSIFLPVERCA
jgi:signal transduction histidine kinase